MKKDIRIVCERVGSKGAFWCVPQLVHLNIIMTIPKYYVAQGNAKILLPVSKITVWRWGGFPTYTNE